MKKSVLLSMLFACSTLIGYSLIIHVPTDQPTIQAGITIASIGDTVLVAKGTYTETINFEGKNIVVASHFLTTGDTLFIDETIISAAQQGPVVTFSAGETEETRLVGFTLTDGTGILEGFAFYGGGIYCKNAHPSLENLIITGNSASGIGGCGGGVLFEESHSQLVNCRISNNSASLGGAIRCNGSDVIIRNTWIENNFAASSGGGIMLVNCNSARIEQCTFTGNNAVYGGAIASMFSHPVLDRVTSFKNAGGYGGTLNADGNSNPKVINSIFWDNSINPDITNEIFLSGSSVLLVAYCDIMGGDTAIHMNGTNTVQWMEGNIEVYPEFNDTATLDLTLSGTSPCVDSGIPIYVYYGDTIINITDYSGTAPDMGAHEYPTTVAIDPVSDQLNPLDFQILSSFSSSKIILFETSSMQNLSLFVHDIQGRMTSFLIEGNYPAGMHKIQWNTENYQQGLYIVTLVSPTGSCSKKVMVLLK